MKTLHPYLNLAGKCEAAMSFYAEVFRGRVKNLRRFGEVVPNAGELAQLVIHSELESDGVSFMATDGPGAPLPACGGAISMAIGVESAEEQDRVWAALAENGKVLAPLHQAFFGRFGMLADQFGVTWMISFNNV
ncbi:putative DNA binding 3-demethylubiquinone-9 3-methyltransferase domain protein [Minicystis rosea]|nr:putative DNA binding 3-demethylubiquinone-9 3-methyltransferase domain protein [Minicystis rosea]